MVGLTIYYVLQEGMLTDKAEQEAKKAGEFHPQVLELAKQVIGRHRK